MKDRAEITIKGKAIFPLNLLSKRLIRIRKVKVCDDCLKFAIEGKQLEKCQQHLLEFNRKFEVTKRRGTKFFFSAAKKRIGAIIGLAFFIVALTVYSLCIFNIEIEGNKYIETAIIKEKLAENIDLPLFNANVDTKRLERQIMSIEGISSASVEKRGTKIKVVVLEELPHTSIEDIRADFVPIKSKYDSVITRMFVTCGTPLVKEGQPVLKGQLLIAPYLLQDEKTTVESKAGGEVYGKVWFRNTKTYQPYVVEYCRTGKSVSYYDIKMLGWIKPPKDPYIYSQKQTQTVYLGGVVPIKAVRYTYFETEKNIVPFDFDDQADILIKEATAELETQLPEDAVRLRKWYEIKRLDKIVQLDIYYEVEIRIN